MTRIYLTLFLLLFSASSFASEEGKSYIFSDYSPVKILYLVNGADLDLEASKAGLKGKHKEIKLSDIPGKEDREFWKFESGQIKTDTNKKTEAKEIEQEKQVVLEKILESSITEAEKDKPLKHKEEVKKRLMEGF